MQVQGLRFSNPSINYLHSEFKNFKLSNKFQTKIKNLKIEKEIKLDNVSFDYPGSKISAVKNISLSIPVLKKLVLLEQQEVENLLQLILY